MFVRKIIVAHPSDLKKYLDEANEIEEFFSHLGSFIDPAVCAKLDSFGEIVLGDVYCPDDDGDVNGSYGSLRKALEDSGAPPEEIARALQDAAIRREALQALMKKNPLENIVPSKFGPGGLPGPYDNDHFNELLNLSTKCVFDNIEMVFKTDMRGYVPSFYSPSQRELTPDDPDYNHVAMAKHRFVTDQILKIQEMEDEDERSEAMLKIKKPGEIIFVPGEDGEPTQYIKEVKPGVRIIKKESDGTLGLPKDRKQDDYFNLTEPGDSRLFEELLMMPLNNVRSEISVFPEYLKYLSEPRNNQVAVRIAKFPKYTSPLIRRKMREIISSQSLIQFSADAMREVNEFIQSWTPAELANAGVFDVMIGFPPGNNPEEMIEEIPENQRSEFIENILRASARRDFIQRRDTKFLEDNIGRFSVSEKEGPHILYRLRSVNPVPVIRDGRATIRQGPAAFVDKYISNADAINSQIVDHYYTNAPRDCFQIDRAPRFFETNSTEPVELSQLNTFYYSSEVPKNLELLRLRAPDSEKEKKLLRPEAFAQHL